MTNVRLGDLIRPAKIARAGKTEYPVLSMTMHYGLVDQAARFKKRIASSDLSDYKVATRGQLVVGFPIDEGVLDFQELYSAGIVSPAYGIWELIDDKRVDRRYLKLALRSTRSFDYYRTKLRGSTARRRSLPTDVFLDLKVRLPPIEEQRQIAAVLDHAGALRAKRRQILDHLDGLTQSIFIEMFGDPLANTMELPRTTIGSVSRVMTGSTPSRANEANFGDSIEWIKSDNLGGDIASSADEWLSEEGRAKSRIAPAGSILVTCIAGSRLSIGKASMVDRAVAFNQQINAIFPSSNIDSAFLLGQLKTAPDLVRTKSTGAMKGLVNKSAFQSIDILLPDLAAQRAFAARMSSVSLIRGIARSSLDASDELFASLESRAFRGEL